MSRLKHIPKIKPIPRISRLEGKIKTQESKFQGQNERIAELQGIIERAQKELATLENDTTRQESVISDLREKLRIAVSENIFNSDKLLAFAKGLKGIFRADFSKSWTDDGDQIMNRTTDYGPIVKVVIYPQNNGLRRHHSVNAYISYFPTKRQLTMDFYLTILDYDTIAQDFRDQITEKLGASSPPAQIGRYSWEWNDIDPSKLA
jgi:uncharacterized coiled-coil protein SlyX